MGPIYIYISCREHAGKLKLRVSVNKIGIILLINTLDEFWEISKIEFFIAKFKNNKYQLCLFFKKTCFQFT